MTIFTGSVIRTHLLHVFQQFFHRWATVRFVIVSESPIRAVYTRKSDVDVVCTHVPNNSNERHTSVSRQRKNSLVWQVAKNTKFSVFEAFVHRVLVSWQTDCCFETSCTVDDVFHDGNERFIRIGADGHDMTSHVE